MTRWTACASASSTRKRRPAIFLSTPASGRGTAALKPGLPLHLDVDHGRRSAIRANHSATHLLHEALRQVLGDHVAQKGSLVAPDRLRFDISHPKPISREELERVEDSPTTIVSAKFARHHPADGGGRRHRVRRPRAVRREIWRRSPRRRHGRNEHPGGNALGWSVELCGGTHVRRTGDIGLVSVARRKRGRRRRAPHRGADRARRQARRQPRRPGRQGRRLRTQSPDRRDAGADRRADGRAQAPGAGPCRHKAQARHGGRRRCGRHERGRCGGRRAPRSAT